MKAPRYRQHLPDLAAYRAELTLGGASLPLPLVPVAAGGLLAQLPPPPVGRTGWPWTIESPPVAAEAPLISIVMPSFRQAAYIEEALRSILLQNHPRLELIVMDGGSDDGTLAVLERYRPWLSHLRVARDRGQAHAINLGFSLAAESGLRGWLNSDDFYLPGAFRRVAEAHRRTQAEFIYGDQFVLRQETAEISSEALRPAWDRYVKFPGLVASHASFWSAARHQPVWEEHHCAIDYELWIRLLPGTRKAYIPHALGLVRHHADAKTFSPAMTARWAEDAERNGRAHPELYRPRPWLDLEYRLVNGLLRRWRAGRLRLELATMWQACGWPAQGPASNTRA